MHGLHYRDLTRKILWKTKIGFHLKHTRYLTVCRTSICGTGGKYFRVYSKSDSHRSFVGAFSVRRMLLGLKVGLLLSLYPAAVMAVAILRLDRAQFLKLYGSNNWVRRKIFGGGVIYSSCIFMGSKSSKVRVGSD